MQDKIKAKTQSWRNHLMYDLLIEPSDKFRWFQDCNIYFANTDDTAQSIFIPQIMTLVLALLFV